MDPAKTRALRKRNPKAESRSSVVKSRPIRTAAPRFVILYTSACCGQLLVEAWQA